MADAMNFASLVGNERIKNLLMRAVAEGRIGQGLIFAGERGVGKYRFAMALAQAVNCEQPVAGDACGVCLTCRKFAARDFTDVKVIVPDGQFIKIEQTRDMANEAQFRPFEGRRRVFIFDEADRLKEQAANAILKTLEEPPETSLIILITAKPYALLETIRSRCQMLNFAPLSEAQLAAYLQANYRRPLEEIRQLAKLGRGSIGRALEIDLGEYREKRNQLMEIIEARLVNRDSVRLLGAAEFMARKLEKEEFVARLDLMMILLEDLFHLKVGRTVESLTNPDIGDRLRRASEVATLEQIMDLAGKMEGVLQNLTRNINRHLAMEAALVGD
jgi:DNA polymerase-3 subunit delta'